MRFCILLGEHFHYKHIEMTILVAIMRQSSPQNTIEHVTKVENRTMKPKFSHYLIWKIYCGHIHKYYVHRRVCGNIHNRAEVTTFKSHPWPSMPETQTQYKHQLQSYMFVAAHAWFGMFASFQLSVNCRLKPHINLMTIVTIGVHNN